jgi:phenylpropionate dioxygenase-like ring-hydroxylating dioxygenase large terminal subunit
VNPGLACKTTGSSSSTPSALLPRAPESWYVVGRSSDISEDRIIDGCIADCAFVMFRNRTGAVVALDAYCPHMGTHLRTGTVVGNGIRCALHHWTISKEGVFDGATRCAAYRSRAWPSFERFGLLFLYAGQGDAPVPPFNELAEDHRWMTAAPLLLKADWRAVLVNGFDTQHMRAVHQRAVVNPPDISRNANGAMVMRYQTKVQPGGGFSSWLTRYLSGGILNITQTCYGPTMLVESQLGRFKSCAVFGLIANGENTLAYASFGAPKRGPLRGLRLWLTKTLYIAFLRKDYAVVEGMRLVVDRSTDVGVQGISAYLRSLPEFGSHRRDA